MCRRLLAAAILLAIVPAARAADPVITYQTQPLGRMLNDVRVLMKNVGGEDVVKSFNKEIKNNLGEKAFEGFDLGRPIVGYVDVPANFEEFTAVVAFPVTGEKEWLEFCERWNKSKPKALKDGLYEVPAPGPGFKAVMKVHEGYAYVATSAKDPAKALDAKTIVGFGNLYDGADTSLMAGKLHFDRVPKELRAKAKELLEQVKKNPGNFPPDLAPFMKEFFGQVHKLGTRWLDLSEGAKVATLRVNANAFTGDADVELTITPIDGSALAKSIEGIKPVSNKFASLVTPDVAGAVRLRLPLDIPEVQATAVAGLEAIQKEAGGNAFPPIKPVIDELLKGLVRTAKTGDVDGVAVLRGPSKDGTFTGVLALNFDDPSGLEKELKKAIDAIAPDDFKQALKWDAEKVGGVSIHTIDLSKMPGGDREIKAIFGNNVMFAFAFGPKASFAAIGPGDEAVAAVKAAMEAKPAPAPLADFSFNPDRIVKLIGTIEPRAAEMTSKIIGTDNKLRSQFALDVTGGKELEVKYSNNIRVMGSFFGVARSSPGAIEPPPPAAK
jgi:hypothetical protein